MEVSYIGSHGSPINYSLTQGGVTRRRFFRMTLSAAPGSSERATRSAPVAAAGALEGAQLGRLVRRIDAGDAGGTGLLLVVGLLLGLILLSGRCGRSSRRNPL